MLPKGYAMIHRLECQEVTIADQSIIQQNQLTELLDRNEDIFAKYDFDIGQSNLMEAELNLENETPIREKPFCTPFVYTAEIQKQLSEYLKAGLISPCNSSYAAPIFAVRKKNGTHRIETDYRKLNDITKKIIGLCPILMIYLHQSEILNPQEIPGNT